MQFRTRFTERVPVQLLCDPDGRRTKSEFKDDVDINKIISRYKRTGQLPDQARAALARYEDLSDVGSYHELYNRLQAAQEAFQALPALVRAEFGNDPGAFLEGVETPEGQEILVKYGLATKRSQAAPVEAPPEGGSPAPAPPESGEPQA